MPLQPISRPPISLPPISQRVLTRTVAGPTAQVAKATPKAKAPPAIAKPGLLARAGGWVKAKFLRGFLATFHFTLRHAPALNRWMGNVTGPFVKARFNPPPSSDAGPAALKAETIEQARQIMAEHFKPQAGKVVIAISGGGTETVHCFVVSDVKPDGSVMITQSLAQYADKAEIYRGVGGWIRKKLDAWKGNQPREMLGVVTDSWTDYAVRSRRNSIAILELDADPAKVADSLSRLRQLVGKPYDQTMLAADPATKSTEMAMYCTEISSWFVNRLRPGTVHRSLAGGGYPVFQVADHMRATTVHGGPLRVLFNGQNRLDIKGLDPFPKDR